MKLLIALFFAASLQAVAQQRPEVPHKMRFADMTLTIRDDARREIQKDVDALTQSPRHFNIKVERAKTYFPIIEKIFAEENVPDDFKYLVIQESALIPDAVSSSNAVGFWQFKDFTAIEMGLRVDREIDERLNIASASRGAARYIKKNNVFFNNWLFALQAYQMGAGGVMRSEKETKSGSTTMEITSKTYWYVKKFLAHKVAFENAVKGKGQIQLLLYEPKGRKALSDVAKEVSVDETELKNYNKWARSGNVPDDRKYMVFIPVIGEAAVNMPVVAIASPVAHQDAGKQNTGIVQKQKASSRINGITTVIAVDGDTPAKLASRARVDLTDFLRWNDITPTTTVASGQPFLLAKKRRRAVTPYHKVESGDDLWKISQQYGVQVKRLVKFNRLSGEDARLQPGTTLWLASTRPRDSDATKPVTSRDVVEVDNGDTFAWEAAPAGTTPVVTPLKEVPVIVVQPQEQKKPDVKPPSVNLTDSTKNIQAVSVVKDSSFSITVAELPVIRKTEHVVQTKETLYAIAKQYEIGVMDLVRWNNLDLQAGIKPGQVLRLTDPAPVEEPAAVTREIWHEVKATDTLYSVARKYNVTIKELMDWNTKRDFAVSVGEKLRIMQK